MKEFVKTFAEKMDSLAFALVGRSHSTLDEQQKIRFYALITFIAIPISIYFFVANLGKVSVERTLLNLLAGASLFLSLFALRRLKNSKFAFRIGAAVLAVYFLFLMIVGGSHGTRMLWTLILPPYFFFLLGKREGLAWTAGAFLGALCVFVDPKGLLSAHEYEGIVKVRFLLTYGLISTVAYFGESARDRYAEQFVQVQTERFERLCANAPFGMIIVGKGGNFEYVNPKFTEIFGYDLSDVPDVTAWFHRGYPDLAPRHKTIPAWQEHVEGLAPGASRSGVFEVTCKDGSKKIAQFRSVKLMTGQHLMTFEDVSDRVRAEQASRESEERFRLAWETSPDALSISRLADGVYVHVNEGYTFLTGYTSDEVLGRSALNIPFWADPTDRGPFKAALEKRGHVRNFETRLRRKDGEERHILVSAGLMTLDGEPHLLAVTKDVEDLKRAEAALRQSEEKYRGLVELSNDIIYQTDADGVLTFVNQVTSRITGYSVDELVGIPYTDLIVPEYRKEVEKFYGRQFIKKEPNSYYSIPLRRKHGDRIWLSQNVQLILKDDEIVGFQAIARDITERKLAEQALLESERRFREVLENVELVAAAIDASGKIIFCNDFLLGLTGWRREEVLGKNWFEVFVGGEHGEARRAAYEDFMRHGNIPVHRENEIVKRNGSPILVRWTNTLLHDLDGKVIGITGIGEDITERKRVEEEKSLYSQRLEALVKLGQMDDAPLHNLATFAMEEAVRLTRSSIGYVAFANEDESILTMHAWSQEAMRECAIENKPLIYPVASTGLWGECVRQRRPVVTNDYTLPNPWKKGTPDGHVEVLRHMNVPIFDQGRIVVVAGVGNKASDYDDNDIRQLTLLMEGMWSILSRNLAEEKIRASLAEKEVLLREIHHRVKNNLQIISSLLRLQERHVEDNSALESFRECRDRIASMAIIHETLYESKDAAEVDFEAYTEALVGHLFRAFGVQRSRIGVELKMQGHKLPMHIALPCGLIVSELVSNCLKHAFADREKGMIRISLVSEDGWVKLRVSDNGKGLPKSVDPKNPNTMGLRLVQILVNQMHGTMEVKSFQGSDLVISFKWIDTRKSASF